MKTFLALLLLLVAISVSGQGTAIRSDGGRGTNTLLVVSNGTGNFVMIGGRVGTGFLWVDGGGNPIYGFVPGQFNVYTQANFFSDVNTVISNADFLGTDANGKVFSQTNIPSGTTIVFNGKVILNSNVFISSLSFKTNAVSLGTTLDLNGGYQDSTTNNNVLYTGFTFLTGTGTTNIAWTTVVLTNTSGSLKTIGFLGCIGDTNVYITNQSAFTVLRYPGRGTNVVGRSLN